MEIELEEWKEVGSEKAKFGLAESYMSATGTASGSYLLE
jgi:hypothetical protein